MKTPISISPRRTRSTVNNSNSVPSIDPTATPAVSTPRRSGPTSSTRSATAGSSPLNENPRISTRIIIPSSSRTAGIRTSSRSPSTTSAAKRESPRGRRAGWRTLANISAAPASGSAPIRNAGAGPSQPISTPPLSAPTTPIDRCPNDVRLTAFASRARPTISACSGCNAVFWKAIVEPVTNTSAISTGTEANPANTTSDISAAAIMRTTAVAVSTRARGSRSETAPAIGPSTRFGIVRIAKVRAARKTEPVSFRTNQPVASRSIHMPRPNSTAPSQALRNSRSSKEAKTPGLAGTPVSSTSDRSSVLAVMGSVRWGWRSEASTGGRESPPPSDGKIAVEVTIPWF